MTWSDQNITDAVGRRRGLADPHDCLAQASVAVGFGYACVILFREVDALAFHGWVCRGLAHNGKHTAWEQNLEYLSVHVFFQILSQFNAPSIREVRIMH